MLLVAVVVTPAMLRCLISCPVIIIIVTDIIVSSLEDIIAYEFASALVLFVQLFIFTSLIIAAIC